MSKTKKYLNLRDTAMHFGVTEKTLRNYLSRYPDFPVVRRGIGREGYKFDVEAVEKWRRRTGLLGIKPATLGTDTVRRNDEAKRQRAELQAQLLEIKLDEMRASLVRRDEVVALLSSKWACMRRRISLVPDIIGRKMGLPHEAVEMLRDYLNQARNTFEQDDINGYFSDADKYDGSGADYKEKPINKARRKVAT